MNDIILDSWQKQFLEYKGHSVTCTGRRVGKTYIHAVKACKRMLEKPNTKVIVASLTEDQAQLIILFAMNYLDKHNKKEINKKTTFTNSKKITLKNGSSIMARPVGNTGDAIRGFEGDILILDEVSRFNELILEAATPILLTTGGEIWMCSTPFGKQGFFWRAYQNKDNRYKIFETNTEEVVNNRPISESWTEEQRKKAIEFLAEEKKEKTELQYGQEYLGLFLEELRRFYNDEWIEKVCIAQKVTPEERQTILEIGYRFAGHDLARMGGDSFTAEIMWKKPNGKVRHIDHYSQKKLTTIENEDLIKEFNKKWNCTKSGIDAGAGSLGVSILDHLIKDPMMRNKIVAMNNRSVVIDRDDKRQRLFNEDMHDNLKSMGEHGEIELLDDEEVKASLRSVQIEFTDDTHGLSKVRIFGNDTHVTEGIIRGAELANTKSSNISISYI
jgi:hypothetical protein